MPSFFSSIRSKWSTFEYNFGWPEYVPLIDGRMAKAALAIPLIGYLIIFNDTVVENITFNEITNETGSFFWLDSSLRLRLLYFGLIFLGVGNLFYRWRRPHVFQFGRDVFEYTTNCLRLFILSDYIQMHHKIRELNHRSMYGKYYDSEWDRFRLMAGGVEGKSEVENVPGHWNDAKNQYDGLLRCILMDTYFRESVQRRWSLVLCLLIVFIGYVLIAIPSLDLFQAVFRTTFQEIGLSEFNG